MQWSLTNRLQGTTIFTWEAPKRDRRGSIRASGRASGRASTPGGQWCDETERTFQTQQPLSLKRVAKKSELFCTVVSKPLQESLLEGVQFIKLYLMKFTPLLEAARDSTRRSPQLNRQNHLDILIGDYGKAYIARSKPLCFTTQLVGSPISF